MGEKGPYRELPIDQEKVATAFHHIVNFAKGYLHAFSVEEAINISLQRNLDGQGFLNTTEKGALIAKLRAYISENT